MSSRTSPFRQHRPVAYCLLLLLLLTMASFVTAFAPSVRTTSRRGLTVSFLQHHMTSTSSSSNSQSEKVVVSTTISSMRVADIRHELQERQVDFADCFDKESLVVRLQDARTGKVPSTTSRSSSGPTTTTISTAAKEETTTTVHKKSTDQSTQSVLSEVRNMTVRALREELASHQIRWAGLLEKEDLVQAVVRARQEAGRLQVGQVVEVTGEELERALQESSWLLLDVYATWCGPCQLVAPQLKEAAAALGDTVRVAKMDSDKEHEASAKYRVQGLPSLILFRNGQEVDRIEGALMKDQIVQWVNSKL